MRGMKRSAVGTGPDVHSVVDDDHWSLIVDTDDVDVDAGRRTGSI